MDNESLKDILGATGIAAVLITVILSGYWWGRKGEALIVSKWAEGNGFKILNYEPRYMFGTGPFFWWNTAAKQPVYYVRVLDQEGHERRGWLRLECKWGYIEEGDRRTEVRWEEPE